MARRGRAAVPLMVVAAASASGFWLGILRHTTNGNLGLVAREHSLDFGEPWEQRDFPWTLVIDNPTSEALEIESLETTCGCTTPKPNRLTIAAGASADVSLKIDLSPRWPSEALSPLTDFSVGVNPVFRLGDRRVSGKGWTIHGRVRHALRPAERAIALGRTTRLVAGRPCDAVTMTATALRRLSGVHASSASPFIRASVSRGPRRDEFLLTVVPTAALPPGALQCFLELRPVTDAGEELPPVKVTVEGLALAPVAAIPDEIDFGLKTIGELAEATIRLERLVPKRFEIIGIQIHDETSERLTVVEVGGDTVSLRLSKQFAKAGNFVGGVRVTIRTADNEPFELSVPVRAYVSAVKSEDASP